MQLGARWERGEQPHPGVPELLHEVIGRTEAQHPQGESWTLTWLEGRPRTELLTPEGDVCAEVRLDARGEVVAVGSGASGLGEPSDNGYDDDDDDDWLN